MKKLFVFVISISFLAAIACMDISQVAGSPSAAPTFDANLLSTIVIKTADAALTQTALHATSTFTATPTFINAPAILPTLTPIFFSGGYKPGDATATPLGNEITNPNFIAGVEAYNNDDFKQAIELMNLVIEANPNLAPPYRYRGITYVFVEDCEAAMDDIETSLNINPGYAAAWAGRALANECIGNTAQMLLDYEKALSLDPSLSFVHHNLGFYYFENGEYGKTLEEYNLALDIDPSRALHWSSMADVLFKLGQYQECIFNANKAIEIDPKYWQAYSIRAFCADFMGDSMAAIKDYKTFIKNGEADDAVWYNLGINQRKTGDSEGAVISYTKALELNPSYYPAHINRGNAYVDIGEYQKALDDFNIALEYSEFPNAYSGRGDAYYGLKKYDKAIEDYKMALSLNPGNAHYSCMLSLSYFEIEEYQESINNANASQEINPDCGGQRLLETEARSYYALKKYDEALTYINKAIAMGEYSLGYYYRGIIYQDAGKKQEATADLEKFLSLVGDSQSFQDEIADAESRLTKLKK